MMGHDDPTADVRPFLLAVPAHADDLDYERAREALERNEVLPLARILPAVERQTGARMIEVEFELEDNRYVYEIELVTPDGRLIEAVVEAATGRIVSVGQEDDD